MTDKHDIRPALQQGGLIDITTIGRRSGEPRRIEIVFFNVNGRIYICGSPGTRDWIANLKVDPRLTFHLKQGVHADLPARARIISDPSERRPIIDHVVRAWKRQPQLDAFLDGAPLVEVTFDDTSLMAA